MTISTELIKSDQAINFIEQIQDSYSAHAKDFTAWVRSQDRAVDFEAVRDYFIHLNGSGYSANTVRVKRQAVKKRIRQLMQDAPIDDRIRLDVVLGDLDKFGETRAPKMATPAIGSEKVISRDDCMTLASKASNRLALIIEFLWQTGCRVSEMTNIRPGDCKLQGGVVIITVTGKGKKQRDVRISETTFNQIRDFYRGEEFLFETEKGNQYPRTYVSEQIRNLSRRVLNRTLGAHSFRHSFATRKIRETQNLKGVSVYLGHSSTAITADMYDHNLLGDSDLLGDSILQPQTETQLLKGVG